MNIHIFKLVSMLPEATDIIDIDVHIYDRWRFKYERDIMTDYTIITLTAICWWLTFHLLKQSKYIAILYFFSHDMRRQLIYICYSPNLLYIVIIGQITTGVVAFNSL